MHECVHACVHLPHVEMLAGSSTPLLVDFYATWCGPCQLLVPILSNLSKRLEGRVQVVKIDSDKYSALASMHQVSVSVVCLGSHKSA
jgi:thioredoxin-like negative regulator of GroEL